MFLAAVLAFAALALLLFAWLIGRATVGLRNHNENLLRALAAGAGSGSSGAEAAAASATSSCGGGGACH
jgi:Na+-transporting NADH:ubiquinone oxidoreductase subunit NqrF